MKFFALIATGSMFFLMSFQNGNGETTPEEEQKNKSAKEEKVEVLDVDKALKDLEKKEFRAVKQKPLDKKKAQDFDTDSGW